MKKQNFLLFSAIVSAAVLGSDIYAQAASTQNEIMSEPTNNSDYLKKTRSATQRVAASKVRRNKTFSDFGQKYTDFKNYLSNKYNIDYSIDISYMAQRGAPAGKKSAFQTIISPSLTWQTFQNEYGTGTLSMAYNIVRYGGSSAARIGNNIGALSGINDYTSKSTSFDELLYTYQLGGRWDWLTIGLGQFPFYNFDGTNYDSNQQVNFVNEALSQNLTSTYSTAGVGSYLQIAPNSEWTFAFGAQDATDIEGESIRLNDLSEEHYATFGYIAYSPTIKGLGDGEYSLLVYNQPWVKDQPQTTNGWSLNLSQDISDKLSLFARINGVSGDVSDFKNSYVLGGVYNDPLDRNPLDQIGLAAAYNKINKKAVGINTAHDYETVLEAYWAWGISKWMTLTPDVQFYINPAPNAKSDYASVYTLRATVFF